MAKHLLPCCFINHSCFLILENVSGIVKFTSVSVLIKHEGSGVVTCCCGGQGGGGGGTIQVAGAVKHRNERHCLCQKS